MGHTARDFQSLFLLPIEAGAGDGVHLGGDFVEETVAVFSYFVEVEVGAVGDVGEVGFGAEFGEYGFEFMSGSVEVEGVCRAGRKLVMGELKTQQGYAFRCGCGAEFLVQSGEWEGAAEG